MSLIDTAWWIPFYSLIGAILTLPWSTGLVRKTGPRPAAYLNLLTTVIAVIHGGLIFRVLWNQPSHQLIFHWFKIADLDLSIALEFSGVSLGAMELITGLSLLAQIYALGYLEKDWAIARFFALMGFFEAAMSGLAISNSLLLSYGVLELLTLSTYLLVGFWYAQPLVVTAARDAFLTKRVGDILLLMGVVTLASLAGTLNFPELYQWVATSNLSPWIANLLGIALIAGPIAKCAQFPLHLWLDEAMEGPNPASILRNSVVVSCGAYILIQLQPILSISNVTSNILVAVGTVTAIGASLVAIAQIDIKRALSHSTSAYLGLVFIAEGMGARRFALLLLLAHAIAKALLFMTVGSIINTTNNQNLTEMGGLWKKMPATTIAFIIGSIGLVGLLPWGGFWALLRGIETFLNDNPYLVAVVLIVNTLTAMNLTRLFRLIFLGKPQPKTKRAPEVFWLMAVPMVSLTLVTFFVPLMMLWLGFVPKLDQLHAISVISLISSGIIGVLLGSYLELTRNLTRSVQSSLRMLQDLLAYDFYVDSIYKVTVVLLVKTLSDINAWIDRYIVDGLVNLLAISTIFGGEQLKYSNSGQSQFYVLTIVVGISLLFFVIGFSLFGPLS